jgi:hypothetical protein
MLKPVIPFAFYTANRVIVMKTYKYPKQNDHDDIEIVVNKLKAEYGDAVYFPMSGLELPETRKQDEWPRYVPVIIFRSGQIYTICSYNNSLQTACPMLKAVLDDEEQAHFDALFAAIEYQKALEFLTENTF